MGIARVWANRLEAGTRKFEDCPEKYQDDVVKCLREDVESGKITPEKFEEITGFPYDPVNE